MARRFSSSRRVFSTIEDAAFRLFRRPVSKAGSLGLRRKVVPILAAVLMLGCAGLSFGQAGIDMGTVTGTVKDPNGALVPGAQLTLTNNATGVVQKTVSTSAGAYSFPLVPVGTYSLQVEAKDFRNLS